SFFFSSRRRHTRLVSDWSSDVCSSDLPDVEELGAHVEAIGNKPDGENINVGCGATDLAALQRRVTAGKFDLGIAFDGDGDRMLRSEERRVGKECGARGGPWR